jgi:hypothetical protein
LYPVLVYAKVLSELKCLSVQILAELESRHGQPEWLQTAFIKELYNCQFPGPGQGLKLSTANTTHTIAGEGRP